MIRSLVLSAALAAGATLGAGSAQAQGLVPCAEENGFCRVPYPTRVIYGVPGASTERFVQGNGIPCNNGVFGDPARGRHKRCAYVAQGGGGYGDRGYDRRGYRYEERRRPPQGYGYGAPRGPAPGYDDDD